MGSSSILSHFDDFKLEAEDYQDTRAEGWIVRPSFHTTYSNGSQELGTGRFWQREWHLGRGGFGEVVKVKYVRQSNGDSEYRAIKMCHRAKMDRCEPPIDYKRELATLAAFSKSQFFVHFQGWWEDSRNVYVMMEYFANGDLQQSLESEGPACAKGTKEIMRDLLQGLSAMHREGFTHRDLKPQNIFVTQRRPFAPNWWVKIGDFGISKRMPDESTMLETAVGSTLFQAPEITGIVDEGRSPYSSAVDLWSLGCVLYTLSCDGAYPFPSRKILKNYCMSDWPLPNEEMVQASLGRMGSDLLKSLLSPRAKDRPTASHALGSRWLIHNWRSSMSSTTDSGYSTSSTHTSQSDPSFSGSTGGLIFGSKRESIATLFGNRPHVTDTDASSAATPLQGVSASPSPRAAQARSEQGEGEAAVKRPPVPPPKPASRINYGRPPLRVPIPESSSPGRSVESPQSQKASVPAPSANLSLRRELQGSARSSSMPTDNGQSNEQGSVEATPPTPRRIPPPLPARSFSSPESAQQMGNSSLIGETPGSSQPSDSLRPSESENQNSRNNPSPLPGHLTPDDPTAAQVQISSDSIPFGHPPPVLPQPLSPVQGRIPTGSTFSLLHRGYGPQNIYGLYDHPHPHPAPWLHPGNDVPPRYSSRSSNPNLDVVLRDISRLGLAPDFSLDQDEESILVRCVRQGLDDLASLLLEGGALVETMGIELMGNKDLFPDEDFRLPILSIAVLHGSVSLVRLLLDKGANPKSFGMAVEAEQFKVSPLHIATMNRDEKIALMLLEEGADPSVYMTIDFQSDAWQPEPDWYRPGMPKNAFTEAIYNHEMQRYTATNPDFGGICKDPRLNALHLACKFGEELLVTEYIKHDASLRSRTGLGNTPLILATVAANEAIVQTLLCQGADPRACNEKGYTALHWAVTKGHEMITLLLLENSAPTEALTTDERSETPLHIAVIFGNQRIVSMLLEKGASINAKSLDPSGAVTVLHIAIQRADTPMLQFLLERGADPTAANSSAQNAYEYARWYGDKKMAKILKSTQPSKMGRLFS